MPRMPRIGSWIWELRTNREEWSDAQYDLFGYRPRAIEPTYDTFRDALHPDDRDRVIRAVAATLSRGTPYRVACRIVRADGDILRVVCAGDLVRDRRGRAARMAGTVQVGREDGPGDRLYLSSETHAQLLRISAELRAAKRH